MKNTKDNCPAGEGSLHPLIVGRLVWAGDLTVNGEDMAGCAVEVSRELLAAASIPMYQDVAIIPYEMARKFLR